MTPEPSSRRAELEAQLQRLCEQRRTMKAEIGELAHMGRRINDALERKSGAEGDLDARRRDLLEGRKLAERDIAAIDAEISSISRELAALPDGS